MIRAQSSNHAPRFTAPVFPIADHGPRTDVDGPVPLRADDGPRRTRIAAEHRYQATLHWAGGRKGTTSSYRAYSREYEARVPGKPALRLTADGAFLGDQALHNPEDLLVIALSGCHMLTYLAECARAGIHVLSYEDAVAELHQRAHQLCFLARSMNFPVRHNPEVTVAEASTTP